MYPLHGGAMNGRLAICLALILGTGCSGAPAEPGDALDAGDATEELGDTEEAGVVCEEDLVPIDGEPCDCEDAVRRGRDGSCDYDCECSFLFWECSLVCDEPEPLRLEWVDDAELDEAEGNGDALINPGETWSVMLAVRAVNAGDDGVNTTVRLTSDTLFIDVEGATTSLEGLGDEAVSLTLDFRVEPNAPARPMIVTAEAFTGFASIDRSLEFEVMEARVPVIELSGVEVQDAAGGPAIRIEAGDTIHVVAELSNTGPVAAEGVVVQATASSGSLTPSEEVGVGVLAPDAPIRLDFSVTVSEDPVDLAPTLTLAVTADNAVTVTEVVEIAIHPPDNLEVTGDTFVSTGEGSWDLEVSVQNSGRLGLTGLDWSRINYESPPPPAEPEVPFFESMGFGAPEGPATLAPGATATVSLPLTVGPSTPTTGRVLLRASSDQRSHGPFALDVTRP